MLLQDSQERSPHLSKNRCRINILNYSVEIRKEHLTNITVCCPGIVSFHWGRWSIAQGLRIASKWHHCDIYSHTCNLQKYLYFPNLWFDDVSQYEMWWCVTVWDVVVCHSMRCDGVSQYEMWWCVTVWDVVVCHSMRCDGVSQYEMWCVTI